MNKQNKLLLGRSIFLLIIIVAFGLIIVNEKSNELLVPKIDKKVKDYINENYNDIKNELIIKKTKYKTNYYQTKIVSKKNKHHFFYVYYKNKKLTDTYKKDYKEGKNILTYSSKEIEKYIKNKTNITNTIKFNHKLNYYTEEVQEKIIDDDKLYTLKIYSLKTDKTINSWTKEEIIKTIDSIINKCSENNINPKNYIITITNKNDITEAIEISNIDNSFINNPLKDQIISAIMNKSDTNIIKSNNIKVKYLN